MNDKRKSFLRVLAVIIYIVIIVVGNILIVKLVGFNIILSGLLGCFSGIFLRLGLGWDFIDKN